MAATTNTLGVGPASAGGQDRPTFWSILMRREKGGMGLIEIMDTDTLFTATSAMGMRRLVLARSLPGAIEEEKIEP